MINVVLPEIVLLDTIKAALTFVRTDYANAVDKQKSYLYLLLNGASLENYGLYQQAIEVICGSKDSPRFFTIDLMFNHQRDTPPSAHITLPSESTGNGNGIGMDENYADTIWSDEIENPVDQAENLNEDTSRVVFSRMLTATYNIVVVSDNSNEVIFLHHFLRALIIACIPHLHLKGLHNIALGGQDVRPYADLANTMYMRALTVNLQYSTYVPAIHSNQLIADVIVVGDPISG